MSWFFILIVGFMGTVVCFPAASLNASSEALMLCIKVVIPSLFPFMVLSRVLIKMGLCELILKWASPLFTRLFGINAGGAVAILMGLIGGFPVGASVTAELYRNREIDKDSAERLLGYTNNAGPLFIIGTVATGLMGEPRLGLSLYLCQLFSALLIGMIFSPQDKPVSLKVKRPILYEKDFGVALGEAVQEAVLLLLNISGFIMLFSVVNEMLLMLPAPSKWLSVLLEITNGASLIANESGLPFHIKFALLSAVIGWSGFSVHMQVLSVIRDLSLKTRHYWTGKGLQALFSFLFAVFMCVSGQVKTVSLFFIFAMTICLLNKRKSRRFSPALKRKFERHAPDFTASKLI